VREVKQGINIPAIAKMPGSFEGASFSFKEILQEMAELEV